MHGHFAIVFVKPSTAFLLLTFLLLFTAQKENFWISFLLNVFIKRFVALKWLKKRCPNVGPFDLSALSPLWLLQILLNTFFFSFNQQNLTVETNKERIVCVGGKIYVHKYFDFVSKPHIVRSILVSRMWNVSACNKLLMSYWTWNTCRSRRALSTFSDLITG